MSDKNLKYKFDSALYKIGEVHQNKSGILLPSYTAVLFVPVFMISSYGANNADVKHYPFDKEQTVYSEAAFKTLDKGVDQLATIKQSLREMQSDILRSQLSLDNNDTNAEKQKRYTDTQKQLDEKAATFYGHMMRNPDLTEPQFKALKDHLMDQDIIYTHNDISLSLKGTNPITFKECQNLDPNVAMTTAVQESITCMQDVSENIKDKYEESRLENVMGFGAMGSIVLVFALMGIYPRIEKLYTGRPKPNPNDKKYKKTSLSNN